MSLPFIIYPVKSIDDKSGNWTGFNSNTSVYDDSNAAILTGINQRIVDGPSDTGIYLLASYAVPPLNIPPLTQNGRIHFAWNHDDLVISLNGAAPISYNSLPPGLTVDTAIYKLTLSVGTGQAGDLAYQQIGPVGTPVEGPPIDLDTFITFIENDLAYDPLTTMLDIIDDGIGIRVDFASLGSIPAYWSYARIEGTYHTSSFSYTIDTPSPIAPGMIVTLSSSGSDALDFTHLDLSLEYNGGPIVVPIIVFITKTPTLAVFTIPSSFGTFEGPVDIVATGDGEQFSGDITLGTRDILIADASGIYRLVDGKTNDTLYISSHGTNNTEDVKIPNPFAKTGPFGG